MSGGKAFSFLFDEYNEWWNNVRSMDRAPVDEWKEVTEKLIQFTNKAMDSRMEREEQKAQDT